MRTEEQDTLPIFGAVPYFRDDTGKLVQVKDGSIYGYWGGVLARYDYETLEKTVFYEAKSTQPGTFCIAGDAIYFMDIPAVDTLTGAEADLYRIKCDGTDLTLLVENVPLPIFYSDSRIPNVKIDIYEDILYLMCDKETVCYKIHKDGSLTEEPLENTLYGLLPEGYTAPWYFEDIPTIPYCARNYGYFFSTKRCGGT